MKRIGRAGFCLLLLHYGFGGGTGWAAAGLPESTPRDRSYGRIPLSFEPNQGQAPARVQFVSRGAGYALFLAANEAVLVLRTPGRPSGTAAGGRRAPADAAPAVVRLRLAGARPKSEPVGLAELPGKSHYFKGSDSRAWRTDIPQYARVRYGAVYPGIDLVYYGNQRQLEYDFVIAPGADPGRIRLKVTGATGLRITAEGDLVLGTPGGDIVQRAPVIYQETAQGRTNVAGGYILGGGRDVRFRIGAYDRSRPLVIDPVLVYSTYLGGNFSDEATGIAVDAAGNAYIAGSTYSTSSFPTASPFRASNAGSQDAFVSKLNASGSALVYSTYLGGSQDDVATGIALDASGNVSIAGSTESDNFPLANAAQATRAGSRDAFVARLNAAGSALIFSTYLGDTQYDTAEAVAVDGGGNTYVTGRLTLGSTPDVLIAKFTPAGARVYFSYFGGSSSDIGRGIAVDAGGNAYVTGDTCSSDFPTLSAAQPTFAGGCILTGDAFVSKVNSTATALVYSTYLGGRFEDAGYAIRVGGDGSAYVTGETTSDDFPTAGALQPTRADSGAGEVFVTKLSPAGTALVYSTYLGGNYVDAGRGIAIDSAGNAYVTGHTYSDDFPVVNAIQSTLGVGGDADAFVAKINPAGSALVYSTYLGGSDLTLDYILGNDLGKAIAVDGSGNAYVVGSTNAQDFPTANARQDLKSGGYDAFIAKISAALCTPGTGTTDTDGDGIPDAVEPAEGRNPCLKDNDIFNIARLFVMQQYRDFLGREGDSGGITYWVNTIGAGTSRATVAKNFFDSMEFQGTIAPVARLYFAYFNRVPDLPGLQYWIAQRRAGTTLDTISQAFANSAEFIGTYGSLNNTQFVTRVYQNVLGRDPEPAGLAYWKGQLDTGAMTRGQVMVGFSESPEYQGKSYNRVFVTMIYYGMLRRVPEPGGFAYWVGQLDAGASGLDLVNAFLGTPEYRSRFLP